MKKVLILLAILVAVVVLAQQKTSTIVVTDTTIATGEVIVTANLGGKLVELQCTQSMPACTSLKNGKYQIVQLPKNHGMYDCQNVQVFAETADPETAQRIGEYCLIQK